MEKKIVFDTGSIEIVKETSDDIIKISYYFFPLYPYGNHVKNVIELEKDTKTLKYYTVRNNWNGTGCDHHGYVKLDESEYSNVYNAMNSLQNVEDFEKLVDIFNSIKKKREDQVAELMDRVLQELEDLIIEDQKRRRLQELTRHDLNEIIENCIY